MKAGARVRTDRDSGLMWSRSRSRTKRANYGDMRGWCAILASAASAMRSCGSRTRLQPPTAETMIAGIVSGEFDRIPEANDAFLELIGYSREDLLNGSLHWPELTRPEYFALDEL